MLVFIARWCIRLRLFPKFFQELVAAHAVGAGSKAYREKDYEEAFKILKPVADYTINDSYVGSAQYIVGLLYLYGLGVKKDNIQAQKYFLDAVNRNHQDAKSYLKLMGSDTEGSPQNSAY